MGKQPFISHVVNGYSRYDVPESKAFTCTPGILYPVRIDFINARDRVSIEQGVDVRSNPLAVPTFNPYTIRLHRFWVPLQLYHPEMRTNSSKFDMNNLSLNWITALVGTAGTTTPNSALGTTRAFPNSLMAWLRVSNKTSLQLANQPPYTATLPSGASVNQWANADSYLAYWDIVRNYYGYSQWGLYSIAWPASWSILADSYSFASKFTFFKQEYANLEFLDAYFESQFYPAAVSSTNNTFNRGNLFFQIINSQLDAGGDQDGYPVSTVLPSSANILSGSGPAGQFSIEEGTSPVSSISAFLFAHPMAVAPSNPDRFSRLIPVGTSSAVSMTGINTIPQLAIASRLQEYKDLLGAGDSRYSDWLDTFFASKIEHVDRPKLLFSASQTVNVQIVMNQAGQNNFTGPSVNGPLGQQGGAIAFNDRLGRRQSYYFREPGYMIDMLSIRPVYFWSGVTPDYLNYQGSDYFNPIYNDIGYQDVPAARLFSTASGSNLGLAVAYEPCFNEFRSSYDEVLGSLSSYPAPQLDTSKPIYSYWVQQRSLGFSYVGSAGANYYPALFVDIAQVNSPFASNVEDNFFVNMSYAVQKKNLVNKSFATRLSNR